MLTTSTLTFRVATTEDIPILFPLIQSAYRGDDSKAGWTTEADLVGGTRITPEGLKSKIETPNSAIIIAFPASKKEPLACCEVLLTPSTKTSSFGLFAVNPKLQGQGTGRQVLEYAEKYVRTAWGAERMELMVIWPRAELIAWYERRGYTVTGERREFPYEMLGEGDRLRDDLYFEVLVKEL